MFSAKTLAGFSAICLFLFAFSVPAVCQFATTVVQFNQGSGSGVFAPTNILGAPSGGGRTSGSTDVLSLGLHGDVTVGFSTTIVNGPGVDFTVFENGFEFPANFMFTELAFVEVSTDGLNFARFPNIYQGPQGPFGSFTTFAYGSSANLVGGLPVIANPATNTISPFNPVFSGGDSFDLSDLTMDPMVLAGTVDLNSINFVRLVDVEGGVDTDSLGTPIWDSTSSSDIDAVAVLNTPANTNPNRPGVEFSIDAFGYLHLVFSDPDGLSDLDPLSYMGSVNLANFLPADLLSVYVIFFVDAFTFDLRSKVPVVGLGLDFVLGAGIRDMAGNVSFDQFVMPK